MRGGFGGGGEAISLFPGRGDWEFIYVKDSILYGPPQWIVSMNTFLPLPTQLMLSMKLNIEPFRERAIRIHRGFNPTYILIKI